MDRWTDSRTAKALPVSSSSYLGVEYTAPHRTQCRYSRHIPLPTHPRPLCRNSSRFFFFLKHGWSPRFRLERDLELELRAELGQLGVDGSVGGEEGVLVLEALEYRGKCRVLGQLRRATTTTTTRWPTASTHTQTQTHNEHRRRHRHRRRRRRRKYEQRATAVCASVRSALSICRECMSVAYGKVSRECQQVAAIVLERDSLQ